MDAVDRSCLHEGAVDAYICDVLMICLNQRDCVDRDDAGSHIANEKTAAAALQRIKKWIGFYIGEKRNLLL